MRLVCYWASSEADCEYPFGYCGQGIKMGQLLEECVCYFKKRDVYKKLFSALRKKYASLGHMGGVIKLSGLSSDEKYDLEGFFKKDLHAEEDVKISYAFMEKSLKNSRFAPLSWEEILTAYFKEQLIINKDKKEKELNNRNSFFEECALNCNNKIVLNWFLHVFKEKGKGSQIIFKMYNEDKKELELFLNKLFLALGKLPCFEKKMLLLPVFAAKTTGNPHFFDLRTSACKLLLSFIEYLLENKNFCEFNIGDTDGLSGIEYTENLLYSVGILKDNVSNTCLVYGLHGVKKDGSIHKGMEGAFIEREPVQVTLKTLSSLECLCTGNSMQEIKEIYVVENPAVFSYLTDTYPDGVFICGNGQFKLAFYITLELLKGKYTIFYAGDFDADGLMIAQKLKNRYPSQVVLWEYNEEYYKRYLSDVQLDNTALAKLEKVVVKELQPVKNSLLKYKMAAYQETMLEIYLPYSSK